MPDEEFDHAKYTTDNEGAEGSDPTRSEPSLQFVGLWLIFTVSVGAICGYANCGVTDWGLLGTILGIIAGAIVGFFVGIIFLV